MQILAMTAGHFDKPRLLKDDTVRLLASADAKDLIAEAKIRKVTSKPQSAMPGADFVPFSILIETPKPIADTGIDVWVAGADWGPIGPVHVFRTGKIDGPDAPALYTLARN